MQERNKPKGYFEFFIIPEFLTSWLPYKECMNIGMQERNK